MALVTTGMSLVGLLPANALQINTLPASIQPDLAQTEIAGQDLGGITPRSAVLDKTQMDDALLTESHLDGQP